MREYIILLPIAFLLTLGAYIALRSGSEDTVERSETGLSLLASNFSALLRWLAGYAAILYALQSFERFPSVLMW